MPKDACYTKVKAQYAVFPSARALSLRKWNC